jgi:hypothetical protein
MLVNFFLKDIIRHFFPAREAKTPPLSGSYQQQRYDRQVLACLGQALITAALMPALFPDKAVQHRLSHYCCRRAATTLFLRNRRNN